MELNKFQNQLYDDLVRLIEGSQLCSEQNQ